MAAPRSVTFVVEPGKVYDLEILTPQSLVGHFKVSTAGARRIKGKRSWWASGEIVESGERLKIRFTETDG
jgi:phage gp46-like protein